MCMCMCMNMSVVLSVRAFARNQESIGLRTFQGGLIIALENAQIVPLSGQ